MSAEGLSNIPVLNVDDPRLEDCPEPVAIVGMGCRLPGGVNDPAGLWDMLMNKGGNPMKVPKSRFNIDAYLHPNIERPGSFNVPGGYFLDGTLQEFDPTPFGISPVEAMWMDPQQRKMLEVCYEAFESAGLTLDQLAGSFTSVFTGTFTSDFQQMSFKEPDFRHSYAATGVDPGILSNRISHVFNLNGPSFTINTACSSSVYALHQACNALRSKDCDAAIIGGSNLIITVDQHMNTAKLGVLSVDSRCKTFDAAANGYGRAEAVGAMYLKRLSDAVRDGDPIRAVVRASAVNANGKVPSVGITHPSMLGQRHVIEHAYKQGGGLNPLLTGYFECHGTGTAIGDPLEVNAVQQAMNKERKKGEAPLLIGAVKTNLGHSEAASGLSAVIKAALAVEKGIIPPIRGPLNNPNPKIDFENWKVKVVTEPTPWPAHLPIRRASVNSFGYGGTNAHVIVESVESIVPGYKLGQPKPEGAAPNSTRPYLLTLSAHDKHSLKANLEKLRSVAGKYRAEDLAYTLGSRRSWLSQRAYAIVHEDTIVDDLAESNIVNSDKKQKNPTLGFVFTGQGAQWPQMGLDLIKEFPSVSETVTKLDSYLAKLSDGPSWTIRGSLEESKETSGVHKPALSQPLCTAVQIVLVDLLKSWGVTPKATVGHSSGEIGAAYAAGYLSAREAITVAYYRGVVVSKPGGNGCMMAVGLGKEGVTPYLAGFDGKVTIACENSPQSVTLSGDADAIDEVKSKLDAEKIFARQVLTGGNAYHSHHMKASAKPYKDLISAANAAEPFEKTKPTARMVSSVYNKVLDEDFSVGADYWCENLTNPVLFNTAVKTLATDEKTNSVDYFVEIGPHSAMSGPLRQINIENGFKIGYSPSMLRGKNSANQALALAGDLRFMEYPINMKKVNSIETVTDDGEVHYQCGLYLPDLPTYQWNYSRTLWAEARNSIEHRNVEQSRHDILGRLVPGCAVNALQWRNILRFKDLPWLKHHSLGGEAVFPAAGYWAMAIEAMTQLNEYSKEPVEIENYTFRNVLIKNALVTPDNEDGMEVLFDLRPTKGGNKVWYSFNVTSVPEVGRSQDHMSGEIAINFRKPDEIAVKKAPVFKQRATGKSWNSALRNVGFDYGPTFQDMDNIAFDGTNYEATSTVNIKQKCGSIDEESRYIIHPATLDATLQLVIVSIFAGKTKNMACGAVPLQADEISIFVPPKEDTDNALATAYGWTDDRGYRSFVSSMQMFGKSGKLMVDLKNLRTVSYEAAVPQKAADSIVKSEPYQRVAWKADATKLTSKAAVDASLKSLFELYQFKNPQQKVLEIGSVLATELKDGLEHVSYTVSVPSEDAIEATKEKLGSYKGLKFEAIDLAEISEDKTGAYDLVIATDVLNVGGNSTLGSLFKLLTPGGKLLLREPTTGKDLWQSTLQAAHFSGADIALPSDINGTTIISSTAVGAEVESEASPSTDYVFVYRESPAPLVSAVEKLAASKGFTSKTVALKSFEPTEGAHVVVLAELEGAVLKTVTEEEFKGIQSITGSSNSLLWVTIGGIIDAKVPEQAMASGLARSVASENASLRFTTLDLDPETFNLEEAAAAVLDIESTKPKIPESEYALKNGTLHVSRMLPNERYNGIYGREVGAAVPSPFNPEERLEGELTSGAVHFRRVREEEVAALPADHVEIHVKTVGVNIEDALVVTGQDYPTHFSHEVAGVISRVGSEVKEFSVGDRVVGFNFDKYSTYQATKATLVKKLRSSESFESVVTLPMAYAAAIYGLSDAAQLEGDERVLILDGTGTVGLAAIQYTQALGATPFVTVSNEADKAIVKEHGIPESQIIVASGRAIPTKLQAMTGESGADIVVSAGSVDSESARETWRVIRPFGKFLDFGRKNPLDHKEIDSYPLTIGANYISVDLGHLYSSRPKTLGRLLERTLKLYREGAIGKIEPLTVVDVAKTTPVLHHLKNEFSHGKTVVSYEKPASEDVLIRGTRPSLKFRSDASYLLVGMLGGLGRSLTSWMMEHGARNFVFMSRSGTDNPAAARLVKEIEAVPGVTTQVIRSDVGILEDVQRAVREVDPAKPIKGVIHAAMVLNDIMFHSMTPQKWHSTVKPKVEGALNLHKALASTPLDFFVATSSTSGTLGTPGQANYAAANSFLDNFARYRTAKGMPSAAIVLPMVLGVGVVAENPEIEEALKRKGIYGIDEDDLLQAFEATIGGLTNAEVGLTDHVIVGMDPAELAISLGSSDTTDAFWIEDTRFKVLKSHIGVGGADSSSGSADTIVAKMQAAANPIIAVQLSAEHITEKLSRLLMVDIEESDLGVKSVGSYGLDSMIGAELRNWIFKEFGADVPFQKLLGASLTINNLALEMAHRNGAVDTADPNLFALIKTDPKYVGVRQE